MKYDLHAHTTASDGVLSPTELVQRAKEQGVDVLAVTDHDTVAGLAEAQLAAQQAELTLIPGVEISVSWRQHTLHIVGLAIEAHNKTLLDGLFTVHVKRIERAKRIAEKLEKLGLEGAWQACCEMAGTEAITRTHFARFIVERGKAPDMQRAFKHWLGHKAKAYVSAQWVELQEAVGWIVAAGGQAVIAHPGRYRMSNLLRNEMIEEFKAAGGVGIEVACSSHDPGTRANMAELARKHQLFVSVGSDFHTPAFSYAELGYNLALKPDLVPIWQTWQ
ncbi:MAG: PHP domain-containing protein [Gammaproteobacteria bacterium]|nr:PHP domain-containing protein [Gammaproteobacteria bacterium]